MILQVLLIIGFGGAAATYGLAKVSSRARDFCAVLVSGALVVVVAGLYGKVFSTTWSAAYLTFPLTLRVDMLSWFFATAISVVGFLSIVFSLSYVKNKERSDFYYLTMLLVNAGMLGIVLSADLLSFYIFWEIMSWSTFLLISYSRGKAVAAGMKYMAMSIVGSVAYLIAMFSIYQTCGTLRISVLSEGLATASQGYILFLLVLFFVAFGIKNAVLPFHTWLPDAHSEAPSPFSAVLSGILVRMGMYGFVLVFFVIVTLKPFLSLRLQFVDVHHIIAWLGALNILIPTFIAMLQNDSKRLLAWSGVGQGGYMVMGVSLGTSLGVSGGIFHIVNHTSYVALLFLVVGAIEYRTGGVRDLDSLGGLIKRMPVTFVGALVGACGLIGVPLTNGFVSKWLIYKTLILNNYPFLAFVALVGTWGSIFAVFKLLHNIFLGQLPEQYKDIKKAPISMQIPILVYSGIILLFGILPGIPLKVINGIIASFGLSPLDLNLWGVVSENGALNTLNILFALVGGCVVVWCFFKMGRKSRVVSQEDSYAAGSAVPSGKYSYTVTFYNPFERMVRPFLRDVIDEFYYWIAARVRMLSEAFRRIYVGDVSTYVVYILLFAALLVISRVWGKLC